MSKRKDRVRAKITKAAKNRKAINANTKIQRYLKQVGLDFKFPMKKREAIAIYTAYVGVTIPAGQSSNDWLLKEYAKKELPGLDQPLPSKKKRQKEARDRRKAYIDYLDSPQWRKKRNELFAIRGRACEKCSATREIHVHHLHYRNIFNEKMEDLQVLCRSCHMAVHEEINRKRKSKKRK